MLQAISFVFLDVLVVLALVRISSQPVELGTFGAIEKILLSISKTGAGALLLIGESVVDTSS